MALLEIEVKAKVADAAKLRAALAASGCSLSTARLQDDTVYVRTAGSLETFLANDVFVRIRREADRTLLTAKKPIAKSPDILVKHEREVVVSSAEETAAMLELMGFVPAVRVVKRRSTGHLGACEVCLDEIEGLGTFIELERMGEEGEAAAIQASLLQELEALGVHASEQVTRGYDILMLETHPQVRLVSAPR